MKTLSDYTIYCTAEQTKKALSLGAPLYKLSMSVEDSYLRDKSIRVETVESLIDYAIPTAEQMRGWLMDKLGVKTFIITHYSCCDTEGYGYLIMGKECIIELDADGRRLLCSDREATLAAIDAALEYLADNKL